MADSAARLTDRVLPEAPVRQWVLSLPFALRYRLTSDRELASAVLGVFVRAVFGSLRRRARSHNRERGRRAQCGAVPFIQRFGDTLNPNVHFQSGVIDGVYLASHGSWTVRFVPLAPPGRAAVERVATRDDRHPTPSRIPTSSFRPIRSAASTVVKLRRSLEHPEPLASPRSPASADSLYGPYSLLPWSILGAALRAMERWRTGPWIRLEPGSRAT